MNDVGGKESGTGLRPPKSSRGGSASDTNFEYDDSEWDVGIGNLIIDLDADIEKNNEDIRHPTTTQINLASSNASSSVSPEGATSMHIPSTTSASATSASTSSSSSSSKTGKPTNPSINKTVPTKAGDPITGSVNSEGNTTKMEHSTTCVDKSLKMKIKRTKPGTKSVDAKHEIVKTDATLNKTSGGSSNSVVVAGVSGAKAASGSSLADSNAKLNSATPSLQKNAQNNDDKTDAQAAGAEDTSKSKTPKRSSTPKKIKTIWPNPSTNSVHIVTPSASVLASNASKKGSGSLSGSSITDSTTSSSTGTGTEDSPIALLGGQKELSVAASGVVSAFAKATSIKVSVPVLQGGISNDSSLGPKESTGSTQKGLSHSTANAVQGVLSSLIKGDRTSSSTFSNGTAIDKSQPGSNASSKRSRGVAHHDKQLAEAEGTDNSSCNSEVQRITRALSQNDHSGHDVCVGTSVGTVTEPDCLGPCEPGTAVTLEGIVWHETENGVLVVNVTWRGKTYVGTLLDCTKNEWASPRFCESPTSDIETRTPKNRAKRGRAQGSGTPLVEPGSSPLDALRASATKLRNGTKGRRGSSNIAASFLTPLSPLKVEPFPKRKTRGSENDGQEEASASLKSAKRIKISSKESSSNSARAGGSPVPTTSVTYSPELGPYSPVLIECPEPNCSKKYKHINGLKYHQSHAHTPQCVAAEDSDSNMSTASTSNLVSTSNNVDDVGESSMAELIDPGVDGKLEEDGESSTTIDNGCDGPNPSIANTTGSTDVDSYVNQFSKGKAKDSTPNNDGGVQELHGQKLVNPLARTPILTIPSFVSSVQNRSMTQQQAPSRILNSNDKSHESQKADGFASTPKGPSVPWQPHVSSSMAHVAPLATPVISSIQSGHGLSHLSPVPRLGDQHGKELKSDRPAEEFQTKKSKHKKKSKDKRDRDRDGKPRVSGTSSRKETVVRDGSPSSVSRRDERKSSSETIEDEDEGRIQVGDPLSPAYSDISDANESGPESEGANKELTKGGGPLGPPEHANLNSGSAPGPTHGFPPFFGSSGLYSPYALNDTSSPSVLNMSSSVPSNVSKNLDKSDGETSGKLSGNSSGPPTSLAAAAGGSNDRRSPNTDYRSKYLPQQYYSYPYSNFHGFEQSPYGLLPENPYNNHPRVAAEEKEREHHMEQLRKTKHAGEAAEGAMLSSVQIKQEPVDRDRGYKDSSSTNKHQSSPIDHSDTSRKSGNSSTFTSSKHHKDHKRVDKDDRERHGHGHKGDNSNLKSGNSKSPGHGDRDKQSAKHPDVDSEKERERAKNEGSKPTMETTGPPPPPTGSYAYIPPGYLQSSPFGLPFDPTHPLYRQVIVPGPYPGTPYSMPSMHPGGLPRFPSTPVSTSIPLPEDLSRPSPPTSVPGPTSKALDLLQHHAAQYYATHKIHELQERALKSPSPQIPVTSSQHTGSPAATGQTGSLSQTPKPSSPRSNSPAIRKETTPSTVGGKTGELTKDVKPIIPSSSANIIGGAMSDSSRSPPTQHHVHSHTHHHTHIGYPIIPTVPPQYSPHYPHVIPPSAAPTPVIPPFTSQKPT